jgi:hypothetical protein
MDEFYKESECIYCQFLRKHLKIVLGDVSAKVRWEYIFKPIVGNGKALPYPKLCQKHHFSIL